MADSDDQSEQSMQSDHSQFSQSQESDVRQKGNGSVPSFLIKLYDILQNGDLKAIIEWNPQGNAFIVHDQNVFCDNILPKYFKHKNFPSFLRQLNMYNFKKSKEDENQKFEHKWFRKDGKALLSNIKRRNQEETEEQDEIPQIVDEIEHFKKAQKELKTEIQSIADSQKLLQSALQMIMQQNETLFQESQQLTQELSNMQSKNQQRFANYSNILTEIVQRLQQEQEEIEKKEQQAPPTLSRNDSSEPFNKKVSVVQIKQEQKQHQVLQPTPIQLLMMNQANNSITMQMLNQMKQQCPGMYQMACKEQDQQNGDVKTEQEQ